MTAITRFCFSLMTLIALAILAGFAGLTHPYKAHAGNLDNPLVQPVHTSCTFYMNSPSIEPVGSCNIFSVPTGKRLVIELVDGIVRELRGGEPLDVTVSTSIMLRCTGKRFQRRTWAGIWWT